MDQRNVHPIDGVVDMELPLTPTDNPLTRRCWTLAWNEYCVRRIIPGHASGIMDTFVLFAVSYLRNPSSRSPEPPQEARDMISIQT